MGIGRADERGGRWGAGARFEEWTSRRDPVRPGWAGPRWPGQGRLCWAGQMSGPGSSSWAHGTPKHVPNRSTGCRPAYRGAGRVDGKGVAVYAHGSSSNRPESNSDSNKNSRVPCWARPRRSGRGLLPTRRDCTVTSLDCVVTGAGVARGLLRRRLEPHLEAISPMQPIGKMPASIENSIKSSVYAT
jgi:hypothetical protein